MHICKICTISKKILNNFSKHPYFIYALSHGDTVMNFTYFLIPRFESTALKKRKYNMLPNSHLDFEILPLLPTLSFQTVLHTKVQSKLLIKTSSV